jgi:hypothetical protein
VNPAPFALLGLAQVLAGALIVRYPAAVAAWYAKIPYRGPWSPGEESQPFLESYCRAWGQGFLVVGGLLLAAVAVRFLLIG